MAERLADVLPPDPPLHNLPMPHDVRYVDERGCPPNCPYRLWAERTKEGGSRG